MKKMKPVLVVGLSALLLLPALSRSRLSAFGAETQGEGGRALSGQVEDRAISRGDHLGKRAARPVRRMLAEEKLVRDVYIRLMRYHTAALDESATTRASNSPQDYISFALRNIHTGPIQQIEDEPLSEVITERSSDVVKITPHHRTHGGGPAHAYCDAEWMSTRSSAVVGPSRLTVHERLKEGGDTFLGVETYTSYEVTVRLRGKERTYRALALHRAQARPEQWTSTILDNITSEMNTVLADDSPQLRSPWKSYIKTPRYSATAKLIGEAKAAHRPLIPADAPLGYLPGDDLETDETSTRDSLTIAIQCCNDCRCPAGLSDGEWRDMSALFPRLERCKTCWLGLATNAYNCMAWTLDITDRPVWLEADQDGDGKLNVSEVDAFYFRHGRRNIAYYGRSRLDVLHVAKQSGGTGPDCQASSKLGQLILMGHDLLQLEGGVYGYIVGGN